ncbi:MAG: ABC transporter permease [Kineosporiaceae bacterium]|jgi:general nucleoside transport system permease protein
MSATSTAGPSPDSTPLDDTSSDGPARPAKTRHGIPGRGLLLVATGVIVAAALVRTVSGADDLTSSGTVGAALGLAVPIGMAALGGLWSERAGVVNIGLEGMMILGTFGAGWIGWQHGPWAGLLAGIGLGALGGLLHAVATVTFGVDHIVSGVAINLLAMGVTQFLASVVFTGTPGGGKTQSPQIRAPGTVSIPGVGALLRGVEERHWFLISDLAGLLRGLSTGISLVTVLALALVGVTGWVLWRTPFGLRLRSCGEEPYAAETLGVNVSRYKYIAVTISGGLAGFGGAYLAVVAASIYREGQTGGRGFIGLAAMIFGNWRPGGLLSGAALFGYTDALQLRNAEAVHALLLLLALGLIALAVLQGTRRRWVVAATALTGAAAALALYLTTDSLPGQVTFMTPYLTTLFVLALASQRLRMPKADGQIYRKGGGH